MDFVIILVSIFQTALRFHLHEMWVSYFCLKCIFNYVRNHTHFKKKVMSWKLNPSIHTDRKERQEKLNRTVYTHIYFSVKWVFVYCTWTHIVQQACSGWQMMIGSEFYMASLWWCPAIVPEDGSVPRIDRNYGNLTTNDPRESNQNENKNNKWKVHTGTQSTTEHVPKKYAAAAAAAAAAESRQSCLTLSDPTDGSPPGSFVPGILQARISFSTSSVNSV